MRYRLDRRDVEALRAAARGATTPREPDWSRLDRALDSAARDAAALPAPRLRTVSAWAAVAVAACVAIAIWLSPGGRVPKAPAPESAAAIARSGPAPGASREPREERRPLPLFVTDSLAIEPSRVHGQVAEGSALVVPDPGELRLALGAGVLVELGPASVGTVRSLDEYTVTLSVEGGTLFVDAPPGALARELTVVADRTTFAFLCGTAEFSLRDGLLEVRVMEGEVVVFDGERTQRLAAGSFGRRLGDSGAPMIPLSTILSVPGDLPGREPAAERLVDGPVGTLPRAVIRQALARATPRIRACYENTLKRHPRATAQVSARLRVDRSGAVSVTGLPGAGSWPGLHGCLAEALGTMRFPPPAGGPVDLVLPLRLVPEP